MAQHSKPLCQVFFPMPTLEIINASDDTMYRQNPLKTILNNREAGIKTCCRHFSGHEFATARPAYYSLERAHWSV